MATDRGVRLPSGASASSALFRLLANACERFPSLSAAQLPESSRAFRRSFPEALVRFEAVRLAGADRSAVAAFLVEASHAALLAGPADAELPLCEAVRVASEPVATDVTPLAGKGRLVPEIPYRGALHRGAGIRALAEDLAERDLLGARARAALLWLLDHALDGAGELDLSERRFALLGAGAELAPTPLLLEAGAEVLWIDRTAPPEALGKDSALSGRLRLPRKPIDLLESPEAAVATLARFAESGPVDLGLYAYAPGAGREWRLEAAMNSIVDALPRGAIRSVSLLVSPTAPLPLGPGERSARERHRLARPLWYRMLDGVGLLGSDTPVRVGDVEVPRLVVALQGASYQAAQYLEKVLAAEDWLARPQRDFSVSAIVAGISQTRSLSRPLVEAAYAGAAAFGVETFAPETTRALNGLLTLHDLLNGKAPGAVGATDADALLAERFHGGFHVVPNAVDPSLRVAAGIGLVKRPALLGRLLRR
jgi:hypothetical protein